MTLSKQFWPFVAGPWILLASLLFFSTVGCTGIPKAPENSYQAYVIAGEARASLITTLAALNNAGYIDSEDYGDIDAAIELTNLALQVWADALIQGTPTEEAEKKFFESFEKLKDIRDPALIESKSRKPDA